MVEPTGCPPNPTRHSRPTARFARSKSARNIVFLIRMLDWLTRWESYLPYGFNSLQAIMGLQLPLASYVRRLYRISLNA